MIENYTDEIEKQTEQLRSQDKMKKMNAVKIQKINDINDELEIELEDHGKKFKEQDDKIATKSDENMYLRLKTKKTSSDFITCDENILNLTRVLKKK